jgi:hypothetical protein
MFMMKFFLQIGRKMPFQIGENSMVDVSGEDAYGKRF